MSEMSNEQRVMLADMLETKLFREYLSERAETFRDRLEKEDSMEARYGLKEIRRFQSLPGILRREAEKNTNSG